MWRTIRYSIKGKPLIDVNEQGVFYSYRSKNIKKLKFHRKANPYYCWCEVDKDVINHTCFAHIEVAKAFPEICGEWFDGAEVHHKDGNALNNEASNLIVCTKEEHVQYHKELKRLKVFVNKRKEKRKKILEEIKNNTIDNKPIRFYCRNSKVDNNGLAPIELSVYINGPRHMISTQFKSTPELVSNGIYPEGFNEYIKELYYA